MSSEIWTVHFACYVHFFALFVKIFLYIYIYTPFYTSWSGIDFHYISRLREWLFNADYFYSMWLVPQIYFLFQVGTVFLSKKLIIGVLFSYHVIFYFYKRMEKISFFLQILQYMSNDNLTHFQYFYRRGRCY